MRRLRTLGLVVFSLAAFPFFPGAQTPTGTGGPTGGTVSNEFSCIDQAIRIRNLTGQYDRQFKTAIAAAEGIDARGAKFVAHKANLKATNWDVEIHSQNPIWIPKGPAGGCWVGGVVESDLARCATFHEHKVTYGDVSGIAWGQKGMKVQGIYIRNIEDDLRPHDGADIVFEGLSPPNTKFNPAEDFDVSHVWTEYIRGDCFENDAYAGGIIRDSLFDGCNAWMSMTPGLRLRHLPESSRDEAVDARNRLDGTHKTVTLDGVLVRMSAMPHPNMETSFGKVRINGILYGGGPFFKVKSKSPRLVIRNSIFVFDPALSGTDTFDFPSTIRSCSDNTIVWLGAGNFPGTYPSSCFTITKDVNIWKAAVRDWHTRHPNVGKNYKPPVSEMGNVAVMNCP